MKSNIAIARKNTSFKFHSFLIYVLLVLLVGVIIASNLTYKTIQEGFYRSQEEKLVNIAKLLERQIDMGALLSYVKEGGLQSHYIYDVEKLLLDVQEDMPDIDLIYIMAATEDPSIWEVILSTNREENRCKIGAPHGHGYDSGAYRIYTGLNANYGLTDDGSSYLSIDMPIANKDGEIRGLLIIDMNMGAKSLWLKGVIRKFTLLLLVSLLLLIFYVYNQKRKYKKNINLLVDMLESFKETDKELPLPEDLLGELQAIGEGINRFAKRNYDFQQDQVKTLKRIMREKDKIFDIYKDIIYSVTQRKIILVDKKEFRERFLKNYPLYNKKISELRDIAECRHDVDNCLKVHSPWLKGAKRNKILLCLSEAITNVIKHAGSGEVFISIDEEKITLYVLDNGPGIDLKELPNMVFIRGYSSKLTSLGSGFHVLYNYTNQIFLSTSKNGTYLALEYRISNEDRISNPAIGSIGEAN